MKKPIFRRIYDYNKKLLPNNYLRSLEENVSNIDQAKLKTGFSIGYPGWNLLYYSALCSLEKDQFNNIIETGTNVGCSTIMLAQALIDSSFDGHVYTVEIDKSNYDKAKNNFECAGVENLVKAYNQNSVDFLSGLSLVDKNIRFAFLDANHEQDHVVKEFDLIYPFLDHKSCVAFDNTYLISDDNANRRVNGALQIIKRKYGGNLINFENVSWHTPGLTFWQKDPFINDWNE
jgi:predicted O-methyltransferase YrrM